MSGPSRYLFRESVRDEKGTTLRDFLKGEGVHVRPMYTALEQPPPALQGWFITEPLPEDAGTRLTLRAKDRGSPAVPEVHAAAPRSERKPPPVEHDPQRDLGDVGAEATSEAHRRGKGVDLCIVESGWPVDPLETDDWTRLGMPQFPAQTSTCSGDPQHAIHTLGLLSPPSGLCPRARLSLGSPCDLLGDPEDSLHEEEFSETVARLGYQCQPGGILLLEAETRFGRFPVERIVSVHNAVTALRSHVLVVAAAGNGGTDLDGYSLYGGLPWTDSGSTLVGATDKAGVRDPESNYGHLLTLSSRGDGVKTIDLNSGDHPYGDTSAAAAIVAGAATLAQAMVICFTGGRRMRPGDLRSILIQTGTFYPAGVGVRPDLVRFLDRLEELEAAGTLVALLLPGVI